VILADSNVPMYMVGGPHVHKSDAQRLLEKFISERQSLVTDAEVLQEILHRFGAIQRRDAIQPAFNALLGVVDEVLPVDRVAVERAKEIVLGIRDCPRAMLCILPSWKITESIAFLVLIQASTNFQELPVCPKVRVKNRAL
jgi:uncharacterized protein